MIVTDRVVSNVENYYMKYISKNDSAHDIHHIRKVYSNILYVNGMLKLNLDPYMMLLAVYLHDVMVWKDRKQHHTLAMEYVLNTNDKYLKKLTKSERIILANAVNEHRSSGDNVFSSTLSEVLSVADTGKLELHSMLRRSYLYHVGENLGPDEIDINAVKEVIKHMHEKFGRKGYMVYSDMYHRVYGSEIKQLHDDIDKLTIDYVVKVLEDKKW